MGMERAFLTTPRCQEREQLETLAPRAECELLSSFIAVWWLTWARRSERACQHLLGPE